LSDLPSLSVVICTYNRKNYLRNCLHSIFKQDYPKSKFEVIVVDGRSVDSTENLVKEEFPQVHFLPEKRRGLAYARNTGARHAKGDIVVFTDDDCIADAQWFKILVRGFSQPNVIAVGGPVCPLNPKTIPNSLNIDGALGLYNRGKTLKIVNKLIGANFAVKRETFSFTRFDVKLGRVGRRLFGLEDIDFCKFLRERGHLILYIPDAKVYHDICPKRISVRYILKRALYEGISYQCYLLKWQKSKAKVIASLLHETLGLLLSLLKKRPFSKCYRLITRITAFLFCLWSLS